MSLTRRRFGRVALLACPAVLGSNAMSTARQASGATQSSDDLAREVGITTSSFSGHLVAKPDVGQFSMLELPRVMRDELDMHVIDLNTSSLASLDAAYLDRCRDAAEKAGCVFTNLKMNQRDVNMNSPDEVIRTRAIDIYKASIGAASRLGCRWARPLPLPERPDMKIHVASYQELADYGAERNVEMLVENYGWMQGDPNSVLTLTEAIGRNVAPCPDTGNWNDNETRYEGLAKTFPTAATCDFKAKTLGPDGEHAAYDLRRCFEIGWKAGFRGPWCLEHANRERAILFRELAMLRDMLRNWMTATADM
ncbi:MAG: TIM barrel protein [Planctomycetaceae bacterium]|nr:TIM barrel protein [Planctomycetaceae bacterium]